MAEKVVRSEEKEAAVAAPPPALLENLKNYGQDHVFSLWDQLSAEERTLLVEDVEKLDLPRIDRIIKWSLESRGLPIPSLEPIPGSCVSIVEDRTPNERERFWKKGLKAISEGKLAVVLLSGGQGTRLGSSDPKGCFNIGLPYEKSLFQLQAERILRIQRLASQSTEDFATTVPIHWYIMTRPFTDEATRKYFETHKYFGLESNQITFFQQGTLPCVSKDGKFIMETPYKVRVADPTFLGYFIDKGVATASKVVRKSYPQEKAGVFVQRGKDGPIVVVEYSEMDPTMSSEINPITGNLCYCWSNVCLHMFTLDFLNQATTGLENDSVYHLAEKKIPSIHGSTLGLKLEQFIFDAFAYSPSTILFEISREEEFAPVKNANGASHDTPNCSRLMLLRLHANWVIAAGGSLTHSEPLDLTGVEISPLYSYAGENLESICKGRTFHAPSEITIE